jgi:hypothetical protein
MALQYQKAAHVFLLNMKISHAELEIRTPAQVREGKEHM